MSTVPWSTSTSPALEQQLQCQVAIAHVNKLAMLFLLLMAAAVSFVNFSRFPSGASVPWWERATISDIGALIAILIAMLAVRVRHTPSLFLWALPFLAWAMIGSLMAILNPPLLGISPGFQLYQLGVIFYVFLLADQGAKILATHNALKWFLSAFSIGVAIQGVIILHDSAAILGLGSTWFPDQMPNRLRGTFRANGQMGQFAMAGLFITFAFAAWPGMKRHWCGIVLTLAAVCAIGAFFASRRSAMICIVIWLGLLSIRTIATAQGRRSIVPFALLCLLGGGFLLFAMTQDDFADFATGRMPNLGGMTAQGGFFHTQFQDTITILSQSPIFGCGIGNAMHYTTDGHELHNGLLAILAETGMIGFLLLIAFPATTLGRLLCRLWYAAKGTPYQELAFRLIIPFLPWVIFTVHNRIWRDRGFWIAVISVYALYGIVVRYRCLHSFSQPAPKLG